MAYDDRLERVWFDSAKLMRDGELYKAAKLVSADIGATLFATLETFGVVRFYFDNDGIDLSVSAVTNYFGDTK